MQFLNVRINAKESMMNINVKLFFFLKKGKDQTLYIHIPASLAAI